MWRMPLDPLQRRGFLPEPAAPFANAAKQSHCPPVREDNVDTLTNMTPLHAAALYVGLLVILMLGLKLFVGNRRGVLKVASGETTPEFSRITRVQLNAVEDVPILAIGIIGLGLLGLPAWYIHTIGAVLVVSRLVHAAGLASSGGFSLGRLIGTLGTLIAYLGIAGALVVHAFTP